MAKRARWRTLRNQILVLFLFVMIVVLSIVGLLTYDRVSKMLMHNAERQIQETAVEASGRMDSLYEHIDMLTTQVATDAYVQQLLLDELEGSPASFAERQWLMPIMNHFQVYSNGIQAFELYTSSFRKLYPLDESGLSGRIDLSWVAEAERQKGRLVWVGEDEKHPDSFLVIRRVSLMDRWFSSGGYLLARIDRNAFQIEGNGEHEYRIWIDRHGRAVVHDGRDASFTAEAMPLLMERLRQDGARERSHGDPAGAEQRLDKVTLAGTAYIITQHQSPVTGWTLFILTPVARLTEGIHLLRTAIFVSGAVGFGLFFIISYLLSTMITRPILNMIRTMRSSRFGELKPNPDKSTIVEIQELTNTYNQMVANINELTGAVYKKEILRSRAELNALQAQINPHFLYNTLDALYWSLQDKEEEELADYVLAMSDLFRYTISRPGADEWVTIGEELEHTERYMQIMKFRFGERLHWRIDTDPLCHEVRIPKLLIQPLVENAVLHGVGNRNGEGTVSVSVRRASGSGNWRIEVSDDGPGMDEKTLRDVLDEVASTTESGAKESGATVPGATHAVATESSSGGYGEKGKRGMAIANLNKRLRLYYEKDDVGELLIDSQKGKGTRVMFEIPDQKYRSNGGRTVDDGEKQ